MGQAHKGQARPNLQNPEPFPSVRLLRDPRADAQLAWPRGTWRPRSKVPPVSSERVTTNTQQLDFLQNETEFYMSRLARNRE